MNGDSEQQGWSNYSKLLETVIKQNGEQVATLVNLVSELRLDVQTVKVRFEALDLQINGKNGTQPLQTRLASLEEQVGAMQEQLAKYVHDTEKAADEERQAKINKDADNRRGEWQLRVALITGFVSLAVALINASGNALQWFIHLTTK